MKNINKFILCILIIGLLIGFFVGAKYEKIYIDKMMKSSVNTNNLIKINNNYYEIFKYEFSECTNEDCVLTIIADVDNGYMIYNMGTTNTSKYKQGFYDGLHNGVDLGYDICDTWRKKY